MLRSQRESESILTVAHCKGRRAAQCLDKVSIKPPVTVMTPGAGLLRAPVDIGRLVVYWIGTIAMAEQGSKIGQRPLLPTSIL